MLVQQILKSKSSDTVYTVKPGTLVRDAAQLLAENRIGTVIVSASGDTADGILSERDIVRELAARGGTCLNDKIDEYMTANPFTCKLSESADEVLQRMTDGRFRHMPVVEDGKLIGLITLGDAVKARLSQLSMEKDALQGMIMGH
ncbi:CBS domain-containing protein [Planktotalea sp.]|uniref:CBS domain-containing protein n=1 Tax=Planktotalea sp. TaxID=2029877 RepID=UPI003D6AF1C2